LVRLKVVRNSWFQFSQIRLMIPAISRVFNNGREYFKRFCIFEWYHLNIFIDPLMKTSEGNSIRLSG